MCVCGERIRYQLKQIANNNKRFFFVFFFIERQQKQNKCAYN